MEWVQSGGIHPVGFPLQQKAAGEILNPKLHIQGPSSSLIKEATSSTPNVLSKHIKVDAFQSYRCLILRHAHFDPVLHDATC